MPERVVHTVLVDNKRRKKGMTFRARMPLPLVAVFVAVALVAAVVVGNQLMQAWSAAHGPSPAGQVHLTALQKRGLRRIHRDICLWLLKVAEPNDPLIRIHLRWATGMSNL